MVQQPYLAETRHLPEGRLPRGRKLEQRNLSLNFGPHILAAPTDVAKSPSVHLPQVSLVNAHLALLPSFASTMSQRLLPTVLSRLPAKLPFLLPRKVATLNFRTLPAPKILRPTDLTFLLQV